MTQLPPPDNSRPSAAVCDQCQTPTCLELVIGPVSGGAAPPGPVSNSGVPSSNGSAPQPLSPSRFPDELVSRYTPRIRGLIRKVAREVSFTPGEGGTWDGADGQDLEQDLWTHVRKRFPRWSGSTPLCWWVALVARNRMSDRLRRHIRQRAKGSLVQVETIQDLPDERARTDVAHIKFVWELVQNLNDPDVTLYYLLHCHYRLEWKQIIAIVRELGWTEYRLKQVREKLIEVLTRARGRLRRIEDEPS